ncbi:MAG: hypothetical protein KAS17_10975 [Victivallaceae bacterium]|nr:hypothetical protein [Victivallaceae bacterium]
MSGLSKDVYAKIEVLREDMAELHRLLKKYPDTFYEHLNVIDNKIDDFREYFIDCKRKGLVEDDNYEPLPDAERIAEYVKQSIPESRQYDVLSWLISSYPPKGTFIGGFKI